MRTHRQRLLALLCRAAGAVLAGAGRHLRLMLVGFFEGLVSERAYRLAGGRLVERARFVAYLRDEATPGRAAVSRTRQLIDAETYQRVFGWVVEQLGRAGFIKGKTLGVDAAFAGPGARQSIGSFWGVSATCR